MNLTKLPKSHVLFALSVMVLIIILACNFIQTAFGQTPDLTVTTSKSVYGPSDSVNIGGNLTYDGAPVGDGLVGVEVRDSADLPQVFRTRPTGTITSDNWLVNITQLYPADSSMNPKYSFAKGNNVYIFVRVKNLDQYYEHPVRICITIYGANMVPIGSWYPSYGNISAGETKEIFFWATRIDNTMASGIATIYGNAYSDFPSLGGYPWSPEKTATFTITGTTLSIQQAAAVGSTRILEADGTYSLSFKLNQSVFLGIYYVYASTFYAQAHAYTATTFEVVLVGDINGDEEVDIFDAIILANAFDSTPSDPNWDSRADIDESGSVDILDAILLANHFGSKAL